MDYTLLITNDDGPESPLLQPFIKQLGIISNSSSLQFVVPESEQSWMAQAATRGRTLTSKDHCIGDITGFLIDGTPADCVSIGIDHLCKCKPDFLLSGINLGHNAGLPYHLSSGTIGAARQAFVHGVKAAAFSVVAFDELYSEWRNKDQKALSKRIRDWNRIAEVCAVVAELMIKEDLWAFADLFSVNIPWSATTNTEIALTYLDRCNYTRLYEATGNNEYLHTGSGYSAGSSRNPHGSNQQAQTQQISDLEALKRGLISLTPLEYSLSPRDPHLLHLLVEKISGKA